MKTACATTGRILLITAGNHRLISHGATATGPPVQQLTQKQSIAQANAHIAYDLRLGK